MRLIYIFIYTPLLKKNKQKRFYQLKISAFPDSNNNDPKIENKFLLNPRFISR